MNWTIRNYYCYGFTCISVFVVCYLLLGDINYLYEVHIQPIMVDDTFYGEHNPRNDTHIVLLWTTFFGQKLWGLKHNNTLSTRNKCPQSNCVFTYNRDLLSKSASVIFHDRDISRWDLPRHRSVDQTWIYWNQESPIHSWYIRSGMSNNGLRLFNATLTYNRRSEIVVTYGYRVFVNLTSADVWEDFKHNKTRVAFIYVSNCNAVKRLALVHQLSQYVPVDIYGACGKPDPCRGNRSCIADMHRSYKFFLAFENSNCEDYVSEKFWNSLRFGSVPVVNGASLADYTAIAPPNSFLHLRNYSSAKEVGQMMRMLLLNDTAYMMYHRWRSEYGIASSLHGGYDIPCGVCEYINRIRLRPPPARRKSVDVSKYWDYKKLCTDLPRMTPEWANWPIIL